MGNDESKPAEPKAGITIQKVNTENPTNFEPRIEEYDGIPTIQPLILRQLAQEHFPKSLHLDCGDLPETHKMVVDYFSKISTRINKNEESIAINVKKQLEDYINLSSLLDKRGEELQYRLNNILEMFKTLDESVNTTTNNLKAAIDQADLLAQKIDSTLPSFKEYQNQ